MLIRLSNAFIRTAAEKLYGRRPEEERLHLAGIRSATPEGENAVRLHEPMFNRFDDTILTFGSVLRLWPGTVDPGKTYTGHPMNPEGTAHLEPGAYRYKLGRHKGKPAFVQAAPVTVRRDRDRDGRAEATEPVRSGYFGVDGHRMGQNGPTVESWSAGCWGMHEPLFKELYTLAATSGQAEFWFWLFDGPALGKLVVP